MMLLNDVVVVFVMLLSGLRCVDGNRTLCLGFDFGFSAAAVFFSSLFRFRSCFSLSFFSFSSFFSRMMFTDCSSVNTRENVVGMPTRRLEAGAGETRSGGGDKIDEIDWTGAGGEERRAAAEDNASNEVGGAWETACDETWDESSTSLRKRTPSLYMAGVIFVRSNGYMPAFSKPMMQL